VQILQSASIAFDHTDIPLKVPFLAFAIGCKVGKMAEEAARIGGLDGRTLVDGVFAFTTVTCILGCCDKILWCVQIVSIFCIEKESEHLAKITLNIDRVLGIILVKQILIRKYELA